MTFFVYENWTHTKAKVHYAECGACKRGRGMHGLGESERNGRWHGAFETLDKAIRTARGTGQPVTACGLCNPF